MYESVNSARLTAICMRKLAVTHYSAFLEVITDKRIRLW